MLLADQILSFQNLFPELNYLFSFIFDIANISFLQAKRAERAIDLSREKITKSQGNRSVLACSLNIKIDLFVECSHEFQDDILKPNLHRAPTA